MDLETLISTTFDQNLENASIRPCLETIFHDLESGKITLCEKIKGEWVVHEWIKKALLLAFRHFPFKRISAYPSWDRIPLRFESTPFDQGRQIPGSIVRRSAYLGPNVVLMPSFINVGAHIGQGTMIDTWSTIGSCAYIGKHCHISGGVGIGGVLEPLQEKPVIIEDNCFIGARSEIAEGVIVQEGSVISMGVFIGASTKIVDRETGKIIQGYIPPYSVVVPGTLPSHHGISLSCAVIVKQVDAKTRSKTSINELLRMV